jgi:taurine--2-oxoglutarate transaminase
MPPQHLYPWAVQAAAPPLTVTRASGSHFYDTDGNRYLDLSGQLAYVNVGHGHPRVVEAIRRQAETLPVISPNYATIPASRLTEMLAELTPGDLNRPFFTLGGAEANEHAIRIARSVTGRRKIVTRYQSYHGSTLGAMAASGDNRRFYAEPLPGGFVHTVDPYRYRCPFCRDADSCNMGCFRALQATVEGEDPRTVAAILIEPVTGLSGLVVPPDGYLQAVRELCDRYGILLILDEVITGFCRTGRWFGSEHWNVVADIMTVAKGITSGYVPLGAAIVSERVAEHFNRHYLGSGLTYSAHPLACAAAVAVLEVYVEEELADRAERVGGWLLEQLRELGRRHPSVGEVRGIGLMTTIELVKNPETREPLTPQRTEEPVSAEMAEVRTSVLAHRVHPLFRWNLVVITPPLTISEAELADGLEAIEAGLNVADRAVG